jgi:signal peptide peptidase SppA
MPALNPARYEHLLGFALEHPWALTESMRRTVADILVRRMVGQEADSTEIAAAMVNRRNLPQPSGGGAVAVIPIYGVIAPRMNLLSDFSGGATFEGLTAQLHEALANSTVKTIVFDVDSPGGNVAGATEFAREVMAARTRIPIIAQVQHLMASAAYWAMAGATEIVASPSAMVGSIGVYALVDDVSAALEKLGVKREVIAAGKYKGENVGGGPLTPEGRAHLTSLIEGTYNRMIADISKGRGIAESKVRDGYAEGRVVNCDSALALKMIDRVGTLAETIARVSTADPTKSRATAATAQEPPVAATAQEPRSFAWQRENEAQRALLELDTI